MDIFNILILALVQGLTEFLPVSSSAHLVIVPALIDGITEQGIGYDVLMHLGTLCAALLYLRSDIVPAGMRAQSLWLSLRELSIAGVYLFISVIPLSCVALLFNIEEHSTLRFLPTIAITNLVFAVALLVAWFYHKNSAANTVANKGFFSNLAPSQIKQWSWLMAGLFLMCGLIQALAIFPGASRSGLIFTLALLLRIRLSMAIFLAFFTAIPSISASLVWLGLNTDLGQLNLTESALAFLLSGLTGYMAMKWFASAIEKWGLLPFVYYRFGLSALLGIFFICA